MVVKQVRTFEQSDISKIVSLSWIYSVIWRLKRHSYIRYSCQGETHFLGASVHILKIHSFTDIERLLLFKSLNSGRSTVSYKLLVKEAHSLIKASNLTELQFFCLSCLLKGTQFYVNQWRASFQEGTQFQRRYRGTEYQCSFIS